MSPERLAGARAAAVLLAGCSRDWRTDMWYQPSLRAEDAPRPEPEGSVPLGAARRFADRDDTEGLADPVPRGGARYPCPSPGSVTSGATKKSAATAR